MRDVEQWRATETEACAKLNALEQQFAELAQLRERHRDLTDPTIAHQLRNELVEAKESLDVGRLSAQEVRRLEAEENSARRALDAAAQRLKQHRDITGRIDASRRTEKALAEGLPAQRAREEEAKVALLHTQEQLAELEAQARLLAVQEQKLGKLSNAIVRATAKDDLARRLAALERASKDLTQINAEIAHIAVKPKHMDDLDELERKIASLDAQLSAAAAQLTVEISPLGEGHVRIGPLEPKGTHTAAVLELTKIAVGDLAVITVMPAPSARHDERRSLDDERSSLLASLGVANAADARAMLSKRRELEANRKGVLAELKTLGVSDDPAPILAQTKKALAEIDAVIEAALSDTQHDRLPGMREIEVGKLELEQKRNQLDARRASLEQTRDQQQEAVADARDKRSGAESQLQLVRKTIDENIALCPDTERAAREASLVAEVTGAETVHQNAAAILDAKRSSAADAAEIERREARCQRLEQALENRKNDLIALEREIGRLTGQIQTAGGDGVGEVMAAAHENRALAERELARVEERIATLKLLRDTITGCLTEGRERYYEPVRRHLRPYLNDLFPGSELELGDGFSITGILRDRAEAFTRLSDGTQEQIAVLVRLAMASMLSERGQCVPVILDDALVYCDDDRIKRMFDALSRAGKSQQVIILTCRLRTFAPLGGHTLRLQFPAEAI
ncbi:MAG: ATP-binding protein [Methylocystis sp.]